MVKIEKNIKVKGFTVPELLIATAIFSIILMVSMASFLQIGRMFYKGITISQTKEVAQHVLDSVSIDLQYANSNPDGPHGSGAYKYLCIGNSRYTYMQNHMVDSSENWSGTGTKSFGLLHDTLVGDSPSCADPFATAASGGVPLVKPVVEMLGNKMRLSNLVVNPINPHNVIVYVAYGDDDILNGATTSPPSIAPTCISNLKSTEFCSTMSLDTIVSKNFNF